MGDTPQSEETLPKANPDSLEPAGPSSPASVTVTVGDEGADTPVGAASLIGDEPESLEGDGGRIVLGERLGSEGDGAQRGFLHACSPCTPFLPASFLGHATKSFPSSPSKGGACPSRAKMSMTGAGKSPPSVQSLAMRLLSMPGAQGAATAGPEPSPATTAAQEGQPKVHRARKTMSKPSNGQVRVWKLGWRDLGSLWVGFFVLFCFCWWFVLLGFFFFFFLLPGFSLRPLVFRFFFFEFTNRLPSVSCWAGPL